MQKKSIPALHCIGTLSEHRFRSAAFYFERLTAATSHQKLDCHCKQYQCMPLHSIAIQTFTLKIKCSAHENHRSEEEENSFREYSAEAL